MMKKYINIKNSIRILFLIYIMCNIYNAEIAKSTYRHDVDYQVSRFQEYNVKPIQIDKTDRLGGHYSVYLYYGDISDKELDSVILDLYNDGFIEYGDKHKKNFIKIMCQLFLYLIMTKVLKYWYQYMKGESNAFRFRY